MKEQFHNSSILSKEKLKQLTQRNDKPAFLKFTLMFITAIAMNVLVITTWNSSWFYLILAQLGYAIICCSLFAALHETGHGTAFKSKKLNRISSFIAGLFHVYTPSMFRALHFTHHRYTHIPGKDPEISLGGRPVPSVISNFGMYLSWLSGIPLLGFKLFMVVCGAFGMPKFLISQFFPFVRATQRRSIFIESIFFLSVYVFVFYYAFMIDERFFGIILGQVVGHCLLAFYVSMEHNGLSHEGDIFDKTRSMKVPKIVRIVMWNMPYHAEHHAYPAVPFHALPDLHKAIQPEITHQNQNHLNFHTTNFSRLFKGKKKSS